MRGVGFQGGSGVGDLGVVGEVLGCGECDCLGDGIGVVEVESELG